MKIAIITFPGTNREHDMAMALGQASGTAPDIIWHKETSLDGYDLIVLPGGFSHGDYLRCGAMAAHSPIMKEVIAQAQKGVRIFGVCNGFQMLIETQLLPGALLRNKNLKFICKQVHLKVETAVDSFMPAMKPGDIIRVPVAHGEGNYFANEEMIADLQAHDQIAFRYCTRTGEVTDAANANGSSANIAGVYNKDKTILGMMPHPEDATHVHHNNESAAPFFKGLLEAVA